MQKHVNLVDLVKSFPTNIYLQNLASIQKRASPVKFDRLVGKSEKGSISNLSTKVARRARGPDAQRGGHRGREPGAPRGAGAGVLQRQVCFVAASLAAAEERGRALEELVPGRAR